MLLLDTNACITWMRGGKPGFESRAISRPQAVVGAVLCSVVQAELLFGALCSQRRTQNLERTNAFLAGFQSLPFDDEAAYRHALIRAELSAKGQLIGPNDLLIAATALAHGAILVTHNTAEFSRVPGLLTEDWEA
ncbi:MAG: type II toxin-antitoxin system VapC family toxin [Dechloromonas sp.]|nr:MAG: type II toxin-antitoxin system VapC family toxin [Dechloromonas sp.]